MKRISAILITLLSFFSCTKQEEQQTVFQNAEIVSVLFNGQSVSDSKVQMGVPSDKVCWELTFNKDLTGRIDWNQIAVTGVDNSCFDFEVSGRTLRIQSNCRLPYSKSVNIFLYEGRNFGVNIIYKYKLSVVTEYDPSDKFERISDDALFEKVQKAAFSYFWDYAHPVSGLARERLNSGETVTSGGSGFGVMTIPVAIERGWITREQGAAQALKIATFLYEKAERFHGVFSHWLNGTTGKAIAFSSYDNGADLVETAFMMQGLLAARQYFDGPDAVESEFRATATRLWEEVEWTWFQRDGQDVLYWHWSPDYDWKMNLAIRGWNEALMVYVLGASSPTYPIASGVYEKGWWDEGRIRPNYRLPMFIGQYSFLGLDPRNLKDKYADYWELVCTHARTNYEYCVAHPEKGYGPDCWGLTASDYHKGYTASSPANDTGTIAPTAALADFPYCPEESMAAMKYFYYVLGDQLWGKYGFKDAFSFTNSWFAESYIAIDQGPIVVMMENYRTGLLWDCFMRDPDVQKGLSRLGFTWK